MQRIYITTPIYYVNGSPHIGHAYTSVAADVLARWHRLMGREVFFLTGTDEHGQKVEQAAAAAGESPQAFADRVSAEFRAMADLMGVSYDDFIRTTEDRHKATCRALWEKLAAAGHIYLGEYEGWYATRDECFYGDDEVTLHPDGRRTAPTGATVERVREPSYFFRLSKFRERLIAHIEGHPDFLAPLSARNEVLAMLRRDLPDLSISRTSFTWGIPVPGAEGHVMYVWLDALTNYLSAVQNAERSGFWPASLHLVGKEIVRFHAIIWPAILMAADLPLPERVFAHGWWTVEGEKMSKSLGNVLNPKDLVEEFGLDPVRYFLLREMPFGNDGDFSRTSLISRINNELANDLGNLAQRTLSLIQKAGGTVPRIHDREWALCDAFAHATTDLPEGVDRAMRRHALHEALDIVWNVVREANAYIARQAPWALRKTDPERADTVLRILLDALRAVAVVLQPFMPGAMARLLDQLGVPADQRTVHALRGAVDGAPLPAPSPIFPRVAA